MATSSYASPGSRPSALAKALARARAYVLDRQSPEGGFCFYRGYYLEEPNLSDTWHAIAALEVMDVAPPNSARHAAFLIAQPIDLQPPKLYGRVRGLQTLGIDDPETDEVQLAADSLHLTWSSRTMQASPAATMERLGRTLWLKKHFGLTAATEDLLQAVGSIEKPQGGYGTPPNLIDTEAAVALLSLCGRSSSPGTAEFLRRMAVPGFGFCLTEDSLSPNLETTCAGILACHRVGLPVPYAADATSFVLSCQTGNGGFARAADALPDLTLTHLALEALATQAAPQSLREWASRSDG